MSLLFEEFLTACCSYGLLWFLLLCKLFGFTVCTRVCTESRFAIVAALPRCKSYTTLSFSAIRVSWFSFALPWDFLIELPSFIILTCILLQFYHSAIMLFNCCVNGFAMFENVIPKSYHVIRLQFLLLVVHCIAVPAHTMLVYCSAVNAAIVLHVYRKDTAAST